MNQSTFLNSFIQLACLWRLTCTYSHSSFSLSQLRGYTTTEDALVAIKSNVNSTVSTICYLEDSAVALDTQQQTSPSLSSSKNPGSKLVDSTKSSTKSRKRLQESSLKCSSASAPKKTTNAVSDPADKERIVAAIVAANTVYGDRSST